MSEWIKREERKREYVMSKDIQDPLPIDITSQFRCPRCKETILDETSILEKKENRPNYIFKCNLCGQKLVWPEHLKERLFK